MRDPARGKNQKARILSPLAIPETIAADRDTERPIRRADRRDPREEAPIFRLAERADEALSVCPAG
jgi:hypothetical protein